MSYCTPTRHHFNGEILQIKSTLSKWPKVATGHYIIEYEYADFKDAKYPECVPKPGSKWARAKYTLRCKCGTNNTYEAQNNTVRPFNNSCKCGKVLATETEEIPIIYQ